MENKTVVNVYKEDVDSMMNRLELAEIENEEMFLLFNEFLGVSNTRNQFLDYLKQLKQKQDDTCEYLWDLDQYIRDFE